MSDLAELHAELTNVRRDLADQLAACKFGLAGLSSSSAPECLGGVLSALEGFERESPHERIELSQQINST